MNELLPGNPPPAPAPAPAPAPVRPSRITCDYCQCSLAADGGVLVTSDRAKDLNRLEERIEVLTREISGHQATIQALTTERDEARSALAAIERERASKDRAPFSR